MSLVDSAGVTWTPLTSIDPRHAAKTRAWWRWHHATWPSVQGLPFLMAELPAPSQQQRIPWHERQRPRKNKPLWWDTARTPAYAAQITSLTEQTTVLGLQPVPQVGRLNLKYNRWTRFHAYPYHFQMKGLRGKLRDWAPQTRIHAPRAARRRHTYQFLWNQPQLHLSTIPVKIMYGHRHRRREQMSWIQRQCCTYATAGLPRLGDKTIAKVE